MEDFIVKFGINWKLLAAQLVNFFLLLVILTKFVYRPLLRMLAERREKIKRGIQLTQEAEVKMAEIDQLEATTLAHAKEEADSIVVAGESRGKEREKAVIEEAGQKADALLADARKTIANDRSVMEQELRKDALALVRQATEKVLARSLSSDDESKLIDQALKEAKTA